MIFVLQVTVKSAHLLVLIFFLRTCLRAVSKKGGEGQADELQAELVLGLHSQFSFSVK